MADDLFQLILKNIEGVTGLFDSVLNTLPSASKCNQPFTVFSEKTATGKSYLPQITADKNKQNGRASHKKEEPCNEED